MVGLLIKRGRDTKKVRRIRGRCVVGVQRKRRGVEVLRQKGRVIGKRRGRITKQEGVGVQKGVEYQ